MLTQKKRIINSVKRWSSDGTCYRQGVHITPSEYDRLLAILDAEKFNPSNDDCYFKLYLFQPLERVGNVVFLNLTQRDFFEIFLKAKLRDDNTYLIIDNNNK